MDSEWRLGTFGPCIATVGLLVLVTSPCCSDESRPDAPAAHAQDLPSGTPSADTRSFGDLGGRGNAPFIVTVMLRDDLGDQGLSTEYVVREMESMLRSVRPWIGTGHFQDLDREGFDNLVLYLRPLPLEDTRIGVAIELRFQELVHLHRDAHINAQGGPVSMWCSTWRRQDYVFCQPDKVQEVVGQHATDLVQAFIDDYLRDNPELAERSSRPGAGKDAGMTPDGTFPIECGKRFEPPFDWKLYEPYRSRGMPPDIIGPTLELEHREN